MSSSVHFRFKSQKEPSRVVFDGTGIQVFDLKREIININRLGDGTEFELAIYNENTNEEYDDDTTIIPRGTSILARRLPANKPGKGGAARYVSGRAPVKALGGAASTSRVAARPGADLNAAQTEEERMKAIMGLEAQNWEQEKQSMATHQKVFYGKNNQSKPTNVPEGEPPHGYVCYRCGKKGHWIQACPTNNDPTFKGNVKIKRTTGIPKSFLTKIEKPEGLDGNTDMSELQGVMVNADGDFVIAHSDEKTWKQYQEKQKQAAAAQEAVASDKELQDRGIECPIDKRMFVDPMKTPCCGRTYCGDCITNALIENDLVCPGCETEGVLIDNLVEDAEAKIKMKAYEDEKASEQKKEKETSKSPTSMNASPVKGQLPAAETPKSPSSVKGRSKSPTNDAVNGSRKRSATDTAEDPSLAADSAAPAMKRQKSGDSTKAPTGGAVRSSTPSNANTSTPPMPLNSFMPPDMSQMSQNFPQMPFPMPNMNMPFMPPAPGMYGTPGMPNMMNMNPMMMANMMGGMPGGTAGFNPMNVMNGGMGMNGMPNMMNGFSNQPFNGNTNNNFQPNQYQNWNNSGGRGTGNMNGMNGNHQNQYQQNRAQQQQFNNQGNSGFNNTNNKFSNQQRPQGNDEDNAYFRQPVNPHRHQNRLKRARPSDYREL